MSGQMALGTRPMSYGTRDAHIRFDKTALGRPLSECNNKQIGWFGEDLSAFYLEECGLEILDRNWRCRFGEIDIVARDGDVLVLVEVKTRTVNYRHDPPRPELAVNSRKRRIYEKLAMMYLSRMVEQPMVRFDVIAVCLESDCESQLRHLVGAFVLDD